MGDAGGESVRVIVRLRPEEESTSADGSDLGGSCVPRIEEKSMTIVDPGRGNSGKGTTKNKKEQQGHEAHDFSFDRVFGPEASQKEVFDQVGPLVHATVDGFTTTVFAYGSTGSGKTHTISGTDEDPGVLPRAVNLLFQRLEADAAAGSDKAFMVFLTYVEIYNNVFHNLLEGLAGVTTTDTQPTGNHASNSNRKPPRSDPALPSSPLPPPPSAKIEVREHPSRGVFLSGGKGLRVPVGSAATVAGLVSRGTKARRTAVTSLNSRSSRSHAILILEIEATHNSPAVGRVPSASGSTPGSGAAKGYRRSRRGSIVDCVSIGKMQVIDLAGSEKVSMSGVDGSALVEAQSINLSLTLLGDVLSALSKFHRAAARASIGESTAPGNTTGGATATSGTAGAEKPFVPYRNSKLTYLLKDSLGGNCKTLMICAVRAAPACFQQTMMSLRYAGRARDIKNVPHRVLDGGTGAAGQGGTSLRGTVGEIERMRLQLFQTTAEFERLRGATASGESEKEELRQQLKVLAEKNRTEKHRMDELLEGVIHGQKGELEKHKEEFVNLQETMDSHAETIEKQKERIRDLQTEREEASSAACTAKEQADELRLSLKRAEQRSTDLHKKVSELKASGELLRIERDSASARVYRLEEEQRKRNDARKAETDETEMYRKAVKKMAKEREHLKSIAREAEERGSQATTALAEIKDDMEAAVAAAIAKEEASMSMKAGLEERARVAEDKARKAVAAAEDLTASLIRKAAEHEGESRARSEAERRRDEALAEATEQAKKARMHGNQVEEAKASAHSAAEDARSVGRRLKEEKKRADDIQVAATSLREELSAAELKLSLAETNLGALSQEKAEAELRRELLETQKGEVEKALTAESTRRSKLEGTIQELKRSTAALSSECETLRKDLAKAASGGEAAAASVRRISADKRTVEEELARAVGRETSLEKSSSVLRDELVLVRKQASSLQEKVDQAAAMDENRSRSLAEKGAEVEAIRVSLARENAKVKRLSAEVQSVEMRGNETLTRAVESHKEEAESLRARLEAQTTELKSVRNELELKIVEAMSMREREGQHARETVNMKNDIDRVGDDMKKLRLALKSKTALAEETRNQLDRQCTEAENLRESLETQLTEAETMRVKLTQQHGAEVEQLCAVAELHKSEVAELREQANLDREEAIRSAQDAELGAKETVAKATAERNKLESEMKEKLEEAARRADQVLREAVEQQCQEGKDTLRLELSLKAAEAEQLLRNALEVQNREFVEASALLKAQHAEAEAMRVQLSRQHEGEVEQLRELVELHKSEVAKVKEMANLDREEATRNAQKVELGAKEAVAEAAAERKQLESEMKEKLEEATRHADQALREAVERQCQEGNNTLRLELSLKAAEAEEHLRDALDMQRREFAEASALLKAQHAETEAMRVQLSRQYEGEVEQLRAVVELHEAEVAKLKEQANLDREKATRSTQEAELGAKEAVAKAATERKQLESEMKERLEEAARRADQALREAVERQCQEGKDTLRLKLSSKAVEAEQYLRDALEVQSREFVEASALLKAQHAEAETMRVRLIRQHEGEVEQLRAGVELHKSEVAKVKEQANLHREQATRNTQEAELGAKEAVAKAAAERKQLKSEFKEKLEEATRHADQVLREAVERQCQEDKNTRKLEMKDILEEAARHADQDLREAVERQCQKDKDTLQLELSLKAAEAEQHLRDALELQSREFAEASSMLKVQHTEAVALAEERGAATSREREEKAHDEWVLAARDELETAERKGKEIAEELRKRLVDAEGKIATLNDQIAAQGREKAAEERVLEAIAARDLVLSTTAEARADVGAVEMAAADAAREAEAKAREALERAVKEAESSRKEVLDLRSKVSEEKTRSTEREREVEITREELSSLRKAWRTKEGELERRLREVQEEAEEAANVQANDHKSALGRAKADLAKIQLEKDEAEGREEILENTLASLQQDLEETAAERDEAETLGQKRGEELGQRVLTLGADLRAEKALSAALRAASETAKMDAEDFKGEIESLKARAIALDEARKAVAVELPQLRAHLKEKDLRCRELLDDKREAGSRLQEEIARASGLESYVERLRTALRRSVATVQQHITSTDPNSPAALLAAETALNLAAKQSDGRTGVGGVGRSGSPIWRGMAGSRNGTGYRGDTGAASLSPEAEASSALTTTAFYAAEEIELPAATVAQVEIEHGRPGVGKEDNGEAKAGVEVAAESSSSAEDSTNTGSRGVAFPAS